MPIRLNKSAIEIQAQQGYEVARKVLNHEAKKFALSDSFPKDHEFTEACAHGDLDEVKSMIAGGADVNQVNEKGYTGLYLSSANNESHIVAELLKSKNIDIDLIVPGHGGTALHAASKNQNDEITLILIEAGADVNARNMDDNTPLFLANKNNIKALLTAGVDINATNNKGKTALLNTNFLSTLTEDIKLLLAAGADINAKNKAGKAAKDLAYGEKKDLLKAAEYTDNLQMHLRGSSTEFVRDIALEHKHKELIGERIASCWNSQDLNHSHPAEAQKLVGNKLVALRLDKDLEERVLTDYTEKLNNFAIQKVADNKIATNILNELLPIITYKYSEVTDEALLPLPETSEILNLAKTPKYLKMAVAILDEHKENPQALLHDIIKGKATIYGSKLPSFEECLAEGSMSLGNVVSFARNVQKLKHKIMTPEMKEVVENITNNACAIEFSKEQAHDAVRLFNPYLEVAETPASGGAGVGSVIATEELTETGKYLEAAKYTAEKYQDNPEILFEKLVKGEGVRRILTLEVPEGLPEPSVLELDHANDIIGGSNSDHHDHHEERAAGGAGVSEPAHGGAGRDESAGDAHSAHDREVAGRGSDHNNEFGSDSVSSARVPTSPAARARAALTEHTPHGSAEAPPRSVNPKDKDHGR